MSYPHLKRLMSAFDTQILSHATIGVIVIAASGWTFEATVSAVRAQAAPAAAEPAAEPASKWKEVVLEEPRNGRTEAPQMLREGTLSDQTLFDDYYKFRLAEFTLEKNRNGLPELRKRIKNEMRFGVGAAHDRLNKLILDTMSAIAADPAYHDAVRINALLLIGELNEREPVVGGAPAVPLAAGLAVLLKYMERTPDSKPLDDALLVAALSGAVRHAQTGVAQQENLRKLLDAALAITSWAEKERPSFRTADAHAFMRLRAVNVFEALGRTGRDKQGTEIAQTLLTITSEKTAPLWLRVEAARALGALDFSSLPKFNYSVAAKVLGELAVQASEQKLPRRAIKAYLDCVQSALNGPSGGSSQRGIIRVASNDHKQFATDLAAKVDGLVAVVDDRKVTDEELPAKLASESQALAQWLSEQNVGDVTMAGGPGS